MILSAPKLETPTGLSIQKNIHKLDITSVCLVEECQPSHKKIPKQRWVTCLGKRVCAYASTQTKKGF